MENQALTQRWEPYRIFFIVLDWIFWNALAVTTGVMVYSAASVPIYNRFGPKLHLWILTGVILGVYVMVDYGLAPKLKAWMRDSSELKKPKGRLDDPQVKEYKMERTLFRVILLFLILRIFATGLSSIWAGSEIGGMMNAGDSTKEFRLAVAKRDSIDAARLAVVENQFNDASQSEAERVKKATRKGDAEIAAAIRKGNRHQREKYAENPKFFDRLSPTSQWTPGNRKFINRIKQAKRNKAAYIAAAKGETEKAEQLLANTVQDTTADKFTEVMAEASQAALYGQMERTARHTNLIIGIDWFCLIGGLFCSWVLVRIERVTKRPRDTRTVAWAFLTWMHVQRIGMMNKVEEMFNIDLDGDGTIGGSPTPEKTTATAAAVQSSTPYPSGGRTIVQPFQPGGYQFGGDVSPTLPGDPAVAELPLTTAPSQYAPSKPLANAVKPLANNSDGSDHVTADMARRAYKNAKSQWHSWKAHHDKAKSEKSRNNAMDHMIRLADIMDENLKVLEIMGEPLDPPKKKK